ncbi:chitin deacetylase [Mortierella sp. 14UC]|nr:chitin deacetylase [Mortierella sp. 14UC]
MILLTMPTLARVVFAAAGAKEPSTEQAIKMLSSPKGGNDIHNINVHTDKSIDYHGVVYHDEAAEEDVTNDEQHSGHGSHGKNRMNMAMYPTRNKIPNVNSPQVKAWIAEIDWSKVPSIPVAVGLAPERPHFPKCPPILKLDRTTCWWSCYGCMAPTDIITCPSANTRGLTYDDGPSWVTRNMAAILQEKKLTATFFVVGSRVLEFPVLREQVAQGHHIGMHSKLLRTWSHSGLTTLTNHEIVAEIRWTEKAIRDVIGLTMKYVRPPFGDINNRIREILRQMGYTIVIWTKGWDTNDWKLLMHEVPMSEIITNFKSALDNRDIVRSSNDKPAGPITLEHDLSSDAVGLSRTLINLATAKGLQPMNIATCLGDLHLTNADPSWDPVVRGMTGMEEQDYNSPSQTVNAGKGPSTPTSDAVAALQQSAVYVTMGLAAVASVMLTLYT